jgi:hypothetical protein
MSTPTLPSRDDHGTTPTAGRCPVCVQAFTPTGRQTYCTSACRKTAFRRRHHTATPPPVVPPGTSRRDVSAYQCDSCGERQLGQQRCDDCNTFGAALGLAGTCPHCDGIIAATDLDQNT